MGIFQRLNGERGLTIVLVTHEPDIAEYATRIVAFRDGRVRSDRPGHASPQRDRRGRRELADEAELAVRRGIGSERMSVLDDTLVALQGAAAQRACAPRSPRSA